MCVGWCWPGAVLLTRNRALQEGGGGGGVGMCDGSAAWLRRQCWPRHRDEMTDPHMHIHDLCCIDPISREHRETSPKLLPSH